MAQAAASKDRSSSSATNLATTDGTAHQDSTRAHQNPSPPDVVISRTPCRHCQRIRDQENPLEQGGQCNDPNAVQCPLEVRSNRVAQVLEIPSAADLICPICRSSKEGDLQESSCSPTSVHSSFDPSRCDQHSCPTIRTRTDNPAHRSYPASRTGGSIEMVRGATAIAQDRPATAGNEQVSPVTGGNQLQSSEVQLDTDLQMIWAVSQKDSEVSCEIAFGSLLSSSSSTGVAIFEGGRRQVVRPWTGKHCALPLAAIVPPSFDFEKFSLLYAEHIPHKGHVDFA